MDDVLLESICVSYGWSSPQFHIIQNGLINKTWKVIATEGDFILQQINATVFTNPVAIDENLQALSNYSNQFFPNYLFVSPIKSKENKSINIIENQFYRAFNFIDKTQTYSTLHSHKLAFEAAKQFGQFTYFFRDFDVNQLHITIPDFHNLSLRYLQLKEALQNGNHLRIRANAALINEIESFSSICQRYELFIQNPDAKKRVTHHDTKISNVLFDENNKGVCVIDLDTVMPGYFLSDVGDMIRTYITPVSEEESNFSKIVIQQDFLQAIKNGYYHYMEHELTEFEKQHFFFAGEMMIYMQAIRFFTDFINDDKYYKINYPEHNLVRAQNQMYLLKALKALPDFA
jgi:Ser/Thr protein kinase RdoA (MazF antagonist)